MAENSPVPPVHPSPGEQPTGVSLPETEPGSSNILLSKKRSIRQKFLDAFAARESSDDEPHALYKEYGPYAESVKITSQMLIGIILGLFLLLKVFATILNALGNPSLHSLAVLNPLDIIAYGLFFSTGVDLAYMLFTPDPDEAINPVMTGLAAAILLGIGQIDYKQIQLQQGITLFLAAGALAGLFAIKKYLYTRPSKKTKISIKNDVDTSLT
jgi:hypothetical protein